MAEGAGEQLGLAQLQLSVDPNALEQGLAAARKQIEAFTPEFKGVQAALADLGAQIDAAFSRLGSLRSQAGGAPAGDTSVSGGRRPSADATAGGVADSKEEKRQTAEAVKQTEEARALRTALTKPGSRSQLGIDAPQQFDQASAIRDVLRRQGSQAQLRNSARERRLIDIASGGPASEGLTLRDLRITQQRLANRRETAPVGGERSLRLTDALNRVGTRIDEFVKVGRETQGSQRLRPNAREALQNFQRPAQAQVDALELRGAPERATKTLRDLIGRISTLQGSGDFGAADRTRREFESRRRAVTQRQTTAERAQIRERRTRLDQFSATRDISNEQFQLNRAKAQGVDISQAQLSLDRASKLVTEGRRQDAREAVVQSREVRRNAQLDVQTERKAAREAQTFSRQRESARDRGSRLDSGIREIEQRSPEFLKRAGVNPQLLRRDLGAVREAQGGRDFESARTLGGELRLRITAALAKLKAFEAELDSTVRNAPSVSAKGRVADVGSPAFAQRGARQGGARESIRTPEEIAKRRFEIERKLTSLEERGVDVSAARNRLQALASAESNSQFGSARKISGELSRQVTLLGDKQARQEKITTAQAKEAADARRAAEQERRRQISQASRGPGLEAGRRTGFAIEDLQARVTKLKAGGLDTAQFENGIKEARNKLVTNQLLSAQRQIEGISRRVKSDENFVKEDQQLRRSAEQAQRTRANEQQVADRRATIPATSIDRGFKQPAFTRLETSIETLGAIGGDTSAFKNRLQKARQNLSEANVVAVERELKQLSADVSQSTSQQRRQNKSAAAPKSFSSAAAAFDFAPKIETPAQLKQYEAALKALVSQTRATDDAFDPLNAVLRQVSAALKGGTTDAATFAGSLKKVQGEATRSGRSQLGVPLPPPRPGALPPPPPPRPPRPGATPPPRPPQDNRVKDAIGSALIGGAFPALFGQGLGASIGGAAGGAGGGLLGGQFGFGLSLIGTAVGAQVDALVARLGTLGSALKDPVANFQELAQAGLISSSGLQKNIEALIASGRTAEAAAQIQLDAQGRFGDTSELTELSDATREVQSNFAQLSVVIGSFAAGPLADIIKTFASFASISVDAASFNRESRDLELPGSVRQGIQSQAERNVGIGAGDRTRSGIGQFLGSAAGNAIGGLLGLPLLGDKLGFEVGSRLGNADNDAKVEKEKLRLLRERRKLSGELTTQEKSLLAAEQRTTALQSNNLNLLRDEAEGRTTIALERKKDVVELQRQNKLEALGTRPADAAVEQINLEAKEQTVKLNLEIEQRGRQSLFGLKAQLQELEGQRLQIEPRVDAQGFVALSQQIVEARAKAEELDGFTANLEAQLTLEGIEDGDLKKSLNNVQSALQKQVAFQATLDIDSSEFVAATANIVKTEDELNQLNGQKALITAELRLQGIDSGVVTNSIQNVQQSLQELNTAQVTLDVDSSEFVEVGRQIVTTEQDLQELQSRQTVVRIKAIIEGLDNGTIPRSSKNIQSLVQGFEDTRASIDINSPSLPIVTRGLVLAREQLDQVDGRKARVEVEVIQSGIAFGEITNNLNNLERRIAGLRTLQVTLPIGSAEFDRVASLIRGLQAQQAAATNNIKESTVSVGDALIAGSRKAATILGDSVKSLRSALESGFRFLTAQRQQQVLRSSLADIGQGVRAGEIDAGKAQAAIREGPESIIQLANTTRSILEAANRFNQSVEDQKNANGNVVASVTKLATSFENGVAIVRQVREPVANFNNTVQQVSQQSPLQNNPQIDFTPIVNSNAAVASQLQANINALNALVAKDWAVSVNVNTDNGAATVQTIQGLQ